MHPRGHQERIQELSVHNGAILKSVVGNAKRALDGMPVSQARAFMRVLLAEVGQLDTFVHELPEKIEATNFVRFPDA